MKKLLTVLLILSIYPFWAEAQFVDTYSVTSSLNYSAVYSTDMRTVREPSTGWEIGIQAEKQLIDHVRVSSGLKLTNIRYGLEDVGSSIITYLTVPLNLKTFLPLNIYAMGGLRLDVKVGSQEARRSVTINGSEGYEFDGLATYSDNFVPGWVLGAGKEFDFNGYRPWIEFSYTKDINNYSGYGSIISMNKNTGKVTVGFPISKW